MTDKDLKLVTDLENRAAEAWDQRFKHVKAANNWTGLAAEETNPHRKMLYETLASWMAAYADADAKYELQFRQAAADVRAAIAATGAEVE